MEDELKEIKKLATHMLYDTDHIFMELGNCTSNLHAFQTLESAKTSIESFHSGMEETTIRLQKFLSERGLCSRRGATKLLDAGRVTNIRFRKETR